MNTYVIIVYFSNIYLQKVKILIDNSKINRDCHGVLRLNWFIGSPEFSKVQDTNLEKFIGIKLNNEENN